MSIETANANAWRDMGAVRDAMELDHRRRVQALMPGESISFVDAPAAAPLRQAQSAGSLANEAQAHPQAQAQAQTQSQSAATAQPPSAEQIAAALQSQIGALLALNLSPFGGVGPGGAAALLATTSAGTAAMAIAANAVSIAATAAPPPPAPTASPDQIALYELLLAEPLMKEMVAEYCPEAPTSLPPNATTDALVAQYGLDLTCRLLQASTAITRVFGDYCDAMDKAATEGPDGGSGAWVFTPGTSGCGDNDGAPDAWHFSAEIFTADYAKGDSLAARAFASAHGKDGSLARITRELAGVSDAGEMYTTTSGGIDIGSAQFLRYDVGDAGSETRWERPHMSGKDGLALIDLNKPPEMFDPKAVWFDPNLGFVTSGENIVPEDNTAEDVVMMVVVGALTFGAGTVICTAYGITNVVAVGAIMGTAGSIIGGLFMNGTVHFEDVVRGAVTGAIMGAVSEYFDTQGVDPKTGAVINWGERLSAIGGKATLQGFLAELSGGEFKDAFGPAVFSGLAAEVGRSINLEIGKALKAETITPEQANTYRTFGRAVTTALGALGNPDDPLAKFAQDFLGDTLKADMPSPFARVAVTADTASAGAQADAVELDLSGLLDDLSGESGVAATGTVQADDGAATALGGTAGNGLTARELEGIEQSDEILFRRGDELAEANGANPVRLPDGRLQYPDGRILTPSGVAITQSGSDSGPTSAYPSQYRHASAAEGVPPVGGYQNLTPAPDLPELPPEATPILPDGRHGSGVPYRDQAGQVFYATYDADDKPVRWVSAAPAAMPLSPVAARAAGSVLTAEMASGNPVLMAAAGATLVGTSWLLLRASDDPFSFSQALPPEKVREDTQPTILVPVSPGPSGTPGQVADSRDTSTPGYQSPDIAVPNSTTIPIVGQTWHDLIVNNINSGNPHDGLAYRIDLPLHLQGPHGFNSNGTLFGTHNLNNAIAELTARGSNYWLTPTSTPGVFELRYDYVHPTTGNLMTASTPKTVYDPSVISDQHMLDLATRAGAAAWTNYTASGASGSQAYNLSEGGINFRVYINVDSAGNSYVGNVHPIN